MSSTLAVGVAGATGYAGQELLRLAARHPSVTVTAAMGSGSAEGVRRLPALARIWDGDVTPLSLDRLAAETRAVFLTLPDAVAAEVGPDLVARGVRVFDLSGTFRLRDAAERRHWYPATPDIDEPVVYGLTEHCREALPDARLVACPDATRRRRCWPCARCATPASSTTPATSSSTPSRASPGPARSRRSAPISRSATAASPPTACSPTATAPRSSRSWGGRSRSHPISCPSTAASSRRSTCEPAGTSAPHRWPTPWSGLTPARLSCASPATLCPRSSTSPTPTCATSAGSSSAASRRLVLVACLDNLVKGAAGQAIQNLNVAFGLGEATGLS